MARSDVRTATQPNLDAIKDFSELTDREDTPFFGGRTDEIATVERALKRIQKRTQEGHWHPAGGETVLFQGAPGAGKSALLHHFVKMWRSSGRNSPVVVNTELNCYVDERRLALRIFNAADLAIAARIRGGKAPLELSLAAVKETLLESKRPVVLILDEAQGLECFDAERSCTTSICMAT